MEIIYLGFHSFREHKRGVENVIDFQSRAVSFNKVYYIHWGKRTEAYKFGKLNCLSVKHVWYWPVILNFIICRIKKKNKTRMIMHSHNPLFSLVSIFKTDILTIHDGLYYLNKSFGKRFPVFYKIAEKLLYFRSSKVHFISNFTKEQSLFGRRKNFIIIPNTSHFESYSYNFRTIHEKKDKKIILVVRSIEERARFDLLLEVAKEFEKSEFEFIVAGKGPLLDYFQAEIKRINLTNIKFLGYVDDNSLIDLYLDCELVLMIAEYGEGFGLPVIEGYLFNKPVIASECCAIPEIIISKDYLFKNNKESIIHSIKYSGNFPERSFSDYYYNKFSNSIILKQYSDLYLNVPVC